MNADQLLIVTRGLDVSALKIEHLLPLPNGSNPQWVLYHKGCYDGTAGLWVIKKRYPNAESIGITPGRPASEILKAIPDGADVHIVDCSLTIDEIALLRERVASVRLLDHHESAMTRLAHLPYTFFDMAYSGAVLAGAVYGVNLGPAEWALLNYVQDRDLWKFELPDSREVSAAMRSFPCEPATFDMLASQIQKLIQLRADPLDFMIRDGMAILRAQAEILKHAVRTARLEQLPPVPGLQIRGWDTPIPIVNVSCLVSETCEALLKEYPEALLACTWSDARNEKGEMIRTYNLRSRKGDGHVNAANIAQLYGGGGHPHAAGFRMHAPQERESLVSNIVVHM